MSLSDTLPQVVVVLFSTLILNIQSCKNERSLYELDEYNNDSIISSRFSTVKRDVFKIGFTLIQAGSFAFLFGWKFDREQDKNSVLSVGLLAVCWIHAFVLSVITISSRSRTLVWIINCHLSIFYAVASICSLWQIRNVFEHAWCIESAMIIGNLVASILLTYIAFTTPKGTKQYHKGRPIIANNHCSFWAYLTYSTVTPLMKKTLKLGRLDDTDLDQLSYSHRASTLYEKFKSLRGQKLLYRIWKANQSIIVLQVVLITIVSCLYYLPMVFFYRFLELIQNKTPDDSLEWGYIYIFGMLLSNILVQLVYGQNRYFNSVIMPCHIRGMLNSEIYFKSLKRFDSVGNTRKINVDDNDNATVGKIANLMSVDTNRICEFAVVWNGVIDCPIELIVGVYFLYQLLGLACLFGLLVLCVTFPINHQTAKLYTNTQDKLMKARDYRTNLMHEILQGIRMIKFFAWDNQYEDRVLEARTNELIQLRNNFLCRSIFELLWMTSPILVSIFSFFIFTKIQGNELTVSIAFTSITIFHELEFAFNALPEIIMDGVQAFVSLDRIEEFLGEEEINLPLDVDHDEIVSKIAFENVTVTWNKNLNNKIDENEFIIKNLNIEFPMGEFSIICGPTGSGKSMLLMSLLRETHLVEGKIHFPRSPTNPDTQDLNTNNWILPNGVALVSQQAWLLNDTIRDNILFGLPFDMLRYDQVVTMCSLVKDFEMFQDGDLTEIGEKGITLSGGQKQRVALARAVYSRAKHILMDDILSAVDAYTARYILNECILGPLMKGRTRILVTHHVRLCLTGATYLLAINNGKINVNGKISELRDSGSLNFILEEEDGLIDAKKNSELLDDIKQEVQIAAKLPDPSTSAFKFIVNDSMQLTKKNSEPKKLIQEEARSTGMVKFKIYMTYLRANGNLWFWLFALLLFISARITQVLGSWWLKEWANASTDVLRQSNTSTIMTSFHDNFQGFLGHDVNYYFSIYVLITVSSIFLGVFRFIWLYYGSLKASRKLYQTLLHRVIRAPLRFFDTTPVGRILNRFSKDFESVDSNLSGDLAWHINNPPSQKDFYLWPLLWLFTNASRELKRLDSVTRSPLFSHFTETLIIDDNNRPKFYLVLIKRWLTIKYNLTGVFVTFITGILLLSNLDHVDPGLAGLSLSFAMQFTEQIMWYVNKYTELEMSLNSIERINEFSEIPQEPPEIIEPRPPASWPHNGAIDVENLKVRYAHDLDPVLHNVSFSVKSQEKVGIVGRTGSGKSTLALTLFRFMEPYEGKIYIDGIDISSIGVYDLRSRITIIPQDPILFTGTLRSNLDVFSIYQDYEILDSLRRVHLLPSDEEVQNDPSLVDNIEIFCNLETPICDGGKNFSQGQRQLLCLARALLKRSKVIIMDEATASIDFAMDEKIQRMIRTEFEDCTVLCIAHRLRTVIDYDRILVIDQGKVVEFDSPYKLIKNTNSLFHKLCQNSCE
ncbi:7291_t:CDS:10 [Funneliformis mosseae]|uniref:7291_t:CDS:1 n=1 Tax=Funneliformis mosseae TaxID=27381 RepID=A0A9N9FQY7_FUNMO|nr:7291_t:CDS:10 [Funneliformis mosseae]